MQHNIFIQIDTEKVLSKIKSLPETDDFLTVTEYSVLYNQGAMVLGTAVKDYLLKFTIGDVINFCVIPGELYAISSINFCCHEGKPFKCKREGVLKVESITDVSFQCKAEERLTIKEDIVFYFELQHPEMNELKRYKIKIDPKLRIDSN